MHHRVWGLFGRLIGWLDNQRYQPPASASSESIDWWRVLPFVALHVALIALLWVGWSPFAVAFSVFMYVLRMFAITGFYHRYFAHKTFSLKTLTGKVTNLLAYTNVFFVMFQPVHQEKKRFPNLFTDF